MVEIPYTPREPDSIRLLFTRIAGSYDLTNHVISMGLDVLWRRRFAKKFGDRSRVADVCCGTGALAPILGSRVAAGLDFTHAMLRVAAKRYPASRLVEGDAQRIPFQDASFDGAAIIYSIRNIPDIPAAMRELHRVLQPGGLLGILDFGTPKGKILEWIYRIYFQRIMPFLGSFVAGDRASYHYFVNSVLKFPKREAFLKMMEDAGFINCRYQEYTLGAALVYTGEKK
jgi:demethylmenaquinone methyltransferase/2-methoxy-6-polyprenyl-1,4-benzoquinol methylase